MREVFDVVVLDLMISWNAELDLFGLLDLTLRSCNDTRWDRVTLHASPKQ
jgi:hypothetical protein